MDNRPHLRRYAGLTVLFVGLLGLFSMFTLAAQGKAGWALTAALVGIALAIGGLRLLARERA